MKLYLLLFTLSILNIISAQNNIISINYGVKIVKEAEDIEQKKYIKAFNELKFSLLINNKNKSVFYSPSTLTSNLFDKIVRIPTNANHKYFTNIATKKTFREQEALGERYHVIYTNNFKWNLVNETKIISGYKVYKAILEREFVNTKDKKIKHNVEAWYCPGINLNFGPLDYNGLPGLILELHIQKIIYYCETINHKTEIDLLSKFKVKEAKEITELELEEIYNKAKENPIKNTN